jgi:hypothetical protein
MLGSISGKTGSCVAEKWTSGSPCQCPPKEVLSVGRGDIVGEFHVVQVENGITTVYQKGGIVAPRFAVSLDVMAQVEIESTT